MYLYLGAAWGVTRSVEQVRSSRRLSRVGFRVEEEVKIAESLGP